MGGVVPECTRGCDGSSDRVGRYVSVRQWTAVCAHSRGYLGVWKLPHVGRGAEAEVVSYDTYVART